MPDESLITESIRFTPGIFQELVPKEYEIRLTMIGKRAFAAKVYSQETATGRLDWRQAYHELRFEPVKLPSWVEDQCSALLAELGLVFGCFDFVVTPEGEYLFLEVNEMGQFLFVERYCGIPLLDAFVSFLLQGTVDYEWNEEDVRVRYTDPEFDALVLRKVTESTQAHVSVPTSLIEE